MWDIKIGHEPVINTTDENTLHLKICQESFNKLSSEFFVNFFYKSTVSQERGTSHELGSNEHNLLSYLLHDHQLNPLKNCGAPDVFLHLQL